MLKGNSIPGESMGSSDTPPRLCLSPRISMRMSFYINFLEPSTNRGCHWLCVFGEQFNYFSFGRNILIMNPLAFLAQRQSDSTSTIDFHEPCGKRRDYFTRIFEGGIKFSSIWIRNVPQMVISETHARERSSMVTHDDCTATAAAADPQESQ